jgi:hypothetical protein
MSKNRDLGEQGDQATTAEMETGIIKKPQLRGFLF